MKKAISILIICLIVLPGLVRSQLPFAFSRNTEIKVLGKDGSTELPNAWAGGLNAPQFSELDINGDAVNDLLIFDRSGNKVLPFIRAGNRFNYEPAFANIFPEAENWMLARDFDGDGQKDLFCSATQGICVYRNVAPEGAQPRFELINPLVRSDYGNGLLNLFVNQIDLPAIADLDKDGDLDILTFYILGTCVEYHRNMSVERFGHRDSLVFRLQSDNWGLFTEDAISNGVYLSDSCDKPGGGSIRHNGSSLLADDPDRDGDWDLFLGDISYRELQLLINQPASGRDVIVPQPENYPPAYSRFEQVVFPAAYRIEDAGNGKPGLLVAPNTDEQSVAADSVCRLYSSESGAFLYTAGWRNFISDEMIDAGRNVFPCVADLDGDGDYDLLLGNEGAFVTPLVSGGIGQYKASLHLYENTGSNEMPQFVLRDTDLGQLSEQHQSYLAPAVADLNGDSFPDLLVGRAGGGFYFLSGTANKFTFSLEAGKFNGLATGQAPAPLLADMDRDGDKDLICGGRNGYFQYYKNTGNATAPQFAGVPDIDRLGGLETIDELRSNNGYSTPSLISINGRNWLFSGSESGCIYAWEIPDAPFNGSFVTADTCLIWPDGGKRSSVAVADFNGDGFPEMIAGNYRGGLEFFSGAKPGSLSELSNNNQLQIQSLISGNTLNWQPHSMPLGGTGEVIDLNGRRLVTQAVAPHSGQFEIPELPPGLYIFRVLTTRGIYHAKFIRIQ